MEKVICKHCEWEGTEDELEMDYYEQYSAMPLATICPKCKNEVE